MMSWLRWIACSLCVVTVLAACQTAPVTGRSQFILLSDAEANQLGVAAYQQILEDAEIADDAARQAQIERVGRRIAAVAEDPGFDWEFTLIENDSPNAFALPGGKVGVHTGLFKVARTEGQLAAVMAHEVGHAIARHSAERYSRQMVTQIGLATVGAVAESQEMVQLAAAGATLGLVLPFNRSQESEADHIGVIYMARAGYDPRESIDLWRNFEQFGGDRPPQFLSTHPSPGNRIERLQSLMPEALAVYRQANPVR